VIAATIHLVKGEPNVWPQLAPLWFALLIAVGFLMVSTWRFYSFKDLNLRKSAPVSRSSFLFGGFLRTAGGFPPLHAVHHCGFSYALQAGVF